MASLVKAGYSLTDVEDTAKEDKLGATLAALTPSSFRHTQTGAAAAPAAAPAAAGAETPRTAAASKWALGRAKLQDRGKELWEAALDGKVDEVRALVAQGTVTNWRGRGGRTPLQAAVMYEDNSAILEALLGAGADVNDVDDQGFTALMIAALKGRVESSKFLLAHGAVAGFKAAAGYYRGRTAAQLAADGKKDMDGVIKRMIEQKMAGETGVASMLGTRRSSVIRSRALKAAMLGTIETAVEVNDQELKKKSRACSIL